MDLRLVSAAKATVFGLEPRDQSEAEALAEFAVQGCNEAAAQERLSEALLAGAFVRVENTPPATVPVADSKRITKRGDDA